MDEHFKILVFGPEDSGKTFLIASLWRSVLSWKNRCGLKLKIFNQNENLRNLYKKCKNIPRSGKILQDATKDTSEYEFSLSLGRHFLGISIGKPNLYHVDIKDGPGGDLLPGDDLDEETDHAKSGYFKSELLETMRNADGLVLCVDSTNREKMKDLFIEIPILLSETEMFPLPTKRVVICLTKVDKLFYAKNDQALSSARSVSPAAIAKQIVGEDALTAIRDFCEEAGNIGFIWTSVYGFLDNGEPNYVESADGDGYLKHSGKHKAEFTIIDNWRPFNSAEMLIFLLTGRIVRHSVWYSSEK